MNRLDVTEMIIEAKLKKGLKWSDIADAVGHSKEWTTAAMLGQMTLSRDEATKVGTLLDLPEAA
ncbi:MAG: cyanate hydratase, partial [Thiobacillus sp.]|nr:cyanate hydratase [Thiobacillus sp.]